MAWAPQVRDCENCEGRGFHFHTRNNLFEGKRPWERLVKQTCHTCDGMGTVPMQTEKA